MGELPPPARSVDVRVEIDPDVAEQIAALPPEALTGYAEALTVLELVPWNGKPYRSDNPDGRMRVMMFGEGGSGLVVYLVFDEPPVVSLLLVTWIE